MKKKRTFGVLAATFAAAVVPMVAASPASADTYDCRQFLSNVGYNVGPLVKAACDAGEGVLITDWDSCYFGLKNIGVKDSDVYTACAEAQR
ncbi:hypothetical protein OHS33_12040 [Streptomyces sp. NBC_00536]|uniref:hypothetical protein n=1 Tax=Streptomyces sp. NBC_00536 TaxID=2975769 RepID=UPI002E80A731|nr:hypothetical protein [Streptomyces sp. NBC_00536]WUC79004.1 hypothetical protein OHS33_12040 [Streptomyces sp. NBC_00536]